MLNHADLVNAVKNMVKVTKPDGKSLTMLQYINLVPKKVVKMAGEGLFAEEIVQDVVVATFSSIDKFRLEYEIPVTQPLPGPIALHAEEALKFLEKAKIRQGEVVTIVEETKKEGKNVVYTTKLGYTSGAEGEKPRIEARLDGLTQSDLLAPVGDLDASKATDCLTVKTATFCKYLQRALSTTSQDIARSNLTWICTAFKDGNMSFTTTDGHRLYRASVRGVEGKSTMCTDTDKPLFITQRIASLLQNILDDAQPFTLKVQRDGEGYGSSVDYEITQGSMRLTVRDDLTGVFPDFRNVLPRVSEETSICTVPCADLVEACDLAKAFPNKNGSMYLKVVGTTLTCSNEKFSQDVSMSAREGASWDVLFGISPDYLKAAILTLSPDGVKKSRSMVLQVWDTLTPVIVRADTDSPDVQEEYQVVMPMRM